MIKKKGDKIEKELLKKKPTKHQVRVNLIKLHLSIRTDEVINGGAMM